MVTRWYKKFQKGSEMYFMFQDFWNLAQEYWNVEDTDEYWDTMVQKFDEFIAKYRTYFSVKLMEAFIAEQMRRKKGIPDDIEECSTLEQAVKIDAKKKYV